MKFLKSKFFLISLAVIFFIFLFQFYFISQSYKVDRNSYVTLIKGNGILTSGTNKKVLVVDKKELLSIGDIVSIVGSDSLGIIEWGDKSITRLSGNSKIIIKENLVSEDLDKINISFELLKGKTWSNIITIIGENSYFKQDIKGVTASVRGTVFEANYDSDYLYVQDHEVTVSNSSGETKKVFAGEGIMFSTFSLENLIKIKDQVWENVNKELDIDYYNNLREQFLDTLRANNFFEVVYNFFRGLYSPEQKVENLVSNGDYDGLNNYISTLTGSEKEGALDILKTINQKLNFESGENSVLYDLKLNIKNTLLENLEDKNYKEILLKYSMYDLSEMLSYDNISKEVVEKTLSFINSNQELIDLTSGNFDFFKGQFSSIKDFLLNGNSNEVINKVKDKLIELDATGKEVINQSLDSLINIFKK